MGKGLTLVSDCILIKDVAGTLTCEVRHPYSSHRDTHNLKRLDHVFPQGLIQFLSTHLLSAITQVKMFLHV